VAAYVSGHGLGHAVRTIETLSALGRARSGLRLLVRTHAARWILLQSARVPIGISECEVDVGVIQIHALQPDEEATARRAAAFYETFNRRIAREAEWLRAQRVDLVLGDIPPLAFAAASTAGVPSLAIGNFTWDWIYEAYAAFDPQILSPIRSAYARATRALRMPFHGGFAPMEGRVTDIPLVARRSSRDPADTRRRLGLTGDRPVVLASFGGYGAPFAQAGDLRGGRLTILTTDRDIPAPADADGHPSIHRLDLERLAADGLRYEDVVAAADVVVSKPGYGIVSECAANGTALLYSLRGHFREQDVFLAEMPRVLRTREIAQPDLLGGRWVEAVEALLAQKAPRPTPANGAEVAANEILKALEQ
jgi:hypothetical protein